MTATNPFAGEHTHPAITYTALPGARFHIAIAGAFDYDVAKVIAQLVRRDLLEARNAGRPMHFVLDLEKSGYIDGRALQSLKGTTALVNGEPGTRFEFTNTNDDLRAHLVQAGFRACFSGLDVNPPRRTPDLEL